MQTTEMTFVPCFFFSYATASSWWGSFTATSKSLLIQYFSQFLLSFYIFQSHEIHGLETYTQYLVSLQVFNPEGPGPATTVLVMTDEGGKCFCIFHHNIKHTTFRKRFATMWCVDFVCAKTSTTDLAIKQIICTC